MIDLDWIRRLIDMVDGSGIDSLEISRFGTRVRIAKSPAATAAPEPAAEQEPDSGLAEVLSPMVGTFYRAPAPDAPPYVEPGDRVEKARP
jgi:acetyl-CoA carboxylase biotin carboxyl carrier protein